MINTINAFKYDMPPGNRKAVKGNALLLGSRENTEAKRRSTHQYELLRNENGEIPAGLALARRYTSLGGVAMYCVVYLPSDSLILPLYLQINTRFFPRRASRAGLISIPFVFFYDYPENIPRRASGAGVLFVFPLRHFLKDSPQGDTLEGNP